MGYQDTKKRYAKAGEKSGGATGLSTGMSLGATVGGAAGGPLGAAIGAGVGAVGGWLIGKSKGKKAGEAAGRRAFLAQNRKDIAKRKRAEDDAQNAALAAGSDVSTGTPVFSPSDDTVLLRNFRTVGSGVKHDAWKSQTFGPTAVSTVESV